MTTKLVRRMQEVSVTVIVCDDCGSELSEWADYITVELPPELPPVFRGSVLGDYRKLHFCNVAHLQNWVNEQVEED